MDFVILVILSKLYTLLCSYCHFCAQKVFIKMSPNIRQHSKYRNIVWALQTMHGLFLRRKKVGFLKLTIIILIYI